VSTPALLETYDAERRPIAWLRHDQIFARRDYAAMATAEEQDVPVIDDDAMELGQLYRSAAVLGAGDDLPPARRPEQWAGQPGTRAPHLWVSQDSRQLSTLDLMQRTWVLLTEDPAWCAAATTAGRELGVELRCLRVSDRDEADETVVSPPVPRQLQPLSRGLLTDAGLEYTPAPTGPVAFLIEVRAAFGIGPTGCSLVRPDGYVAWRSVDRPSDPLAAVTEALLAAGQITRR
jgi:hypothetical protein